MAGGTPVRPEERFLVFGAPVIGEAEIAGVVDCLRRRWVGTGPKVQEFEHEFARYKGAANAVAVSSGTAALHLALLAAGVGPGDEVITSAMTFCSTVSAVIHVGASPVLVDCDRRSLNIRADQIAERITTGCLTREHSRIRLRVGSYLRVSIGILRTDLPAGAIAQ